MFELDLLSERARVTPDKLALVSVESGERLTYAELDARASRAARMLAAELDPGDRFGLLAYNCVEYLELFFGAIKAGVIVVPLSTRATAHELTHIARDCDMRLLFHGPEFAEVAGQVGVETRELVAACAAPHPASGHLLPAGGEKGNKQGVSRESSLSSLAPRQRGEGGRRPGEGRMESRQVVESSSRQDSGTFPLTTRRPDDSTTFPLTTRRPDDSTTFPLTTRRPDDSTTCLLYTSGTTGKPKGVMIPRRQLWWNGYNTAINWGLRDDDVTPVYTPLYHAGGLAAFMIPIFCAGGTVVLHRAFEPGEVWRTFERERCTVALGVPTIWKMLMEAPEFATTDLSHVRWVISGGAPLPHYIIEAYQRRGIVFKQGYGMTEVGVNCFTMTVEESFRKPGSIGRPMLFTEVRIVAQNGEDADVNEVGEMWIRGPHVSSGYWRNESATREAYTEDGWLKTGDLARRDEEGFFYIAGRRKEMFISGGVNVYPAEIEAELVAHPAVADAAVIAVADETWGEIGVAFVVGSASGAQLDDYLTSRLSKYKVPKRFVFVDALPRSAYGKVLKEELRKKLS